MKGVAELAQAAPALDDAYKNDFMLLATECVIKAVESRLARGAQNRQALVNQAVSQGFVLTAALADGLAAYEKQPESLRIYFPDLLGQIDLEHEDKRLQKVEFAKEATVHKAKAAPPPPAPVLSPSAKTLAEAEDLYASRNLTAAQESYRNVLQQPAENPVHARAYYGLARIAALDHDPELAEKLFQKTLEMSPDDDTKSWAYLYLGRLSDAAGEREQAEKHYRAALAVRGAPEQVKSRRRERARAAVSTVDCEWFQRRHRKIQNRGAMMKRAFRNIAALTWAALALGYSPLWAQKPKSQKEQQAILAVQLAKTPDERIQAIENVLTNFADTEFKVALLQMAVQSEQQKDDYAQTVFYAQRLLTADPKNTFALVTLASETARHTRDNDLDKDENLAKVDKWAKDAVESAKTMPKIRADVSDADWDGFKKDMEAQAYEALGMADMVRKNYDGAAASYRKSLETSVTQNPATLVRLAQVYIAGRQAGQCNVHFGQGHQHSECSAAGEINR